MKPITKMTLEERKAAFETYLKAHVRSYSRYIKALEKGYSEAKIKKYKTIYDIIKPEVLENTEITKNLRESSTFTRTTKGGTDGLAGLNWYIRFLKDNRDSYYDFMQHFGIKKMDLFDWGMKAIIFPSDKEISKEWENLKHRVLSNGKVYIRSYGRKANGTDLYIGLYNYVFQNANVKTDATNNSKPTSTMKRTTGLTRNKDIYNYQVSHIWGRTKNPLLFEAPWNICYTPKIIDPFTGHETKGDLPLEFQEYFIEYATRKYKKYIDEYNEIISKYDIEELINECCAINNINDEKFIEDANKELATI